MNLRPVIRFAPHPIAVLDARADAFDQRMPDIARPVPSWIERQFKHGIRVVGTEKHKGNIGRMTGKYCEIDAASNQSGSKRQRRAARHTEFGIRDRQQPLSLREAIVCRDSG